MNCYLARRVQTHLCTPSTNTFELVQMIIIVDSIDENEPKMGKR